MIVPLSQKRTTTTQVPRVQGAGVVQVQYGLHQARAQDGRAPLPRQGTPGMGTQDLSISSFSRTGV